MAHPSFRGRGGRRFPLSTELCLALAVACGALTACSSSTSSQDQLVAKGNQFEVTVTELDQLLRLAPPVRKEDVIAARRAILNQLIDDKLMADAALDKKMDRDPDVMQQLEAAKRSVLARAYANRLFANMPDPSQQAIQKYYSEHPKLFENRTAYSVEQLPITGTPEAVANLRSIFDKQGLDALQADMQRRGQFVQRAHETILDIQLAGVNPDALAKLTAGSKIAYTNEGVSHVGVITGIEHGTLTLDQARDEVSQRILADRRMEVVKTELKRLRDEHQVNLIEDSLHAKGVD